MTDVYSGTREAGPPKRTIVCNSKISAAIPNSALQHCTAHVSRDNQSRVGDVRRRASCVLETLDVRCVSRGKAVLPSDSEAVVVRFESQAICGKIYYTKIHILVLLNVIVDGIP